MISCHVERPLDDRVWAAFSSIQRQFPVAALLRPPDEDAGESEEPWLRRAREAAGRGPIGHHTHWTSPSHARPTGAGEPGERVQREGDWLRERGIEATLFCGGGWYSDEGVARSCAALGYADCTPRAGRPPYLADGARWVELASPARLTLPGREPLLALPTTHSAGDLLRALVRPRGLGSDVIHVYFHDTDLVDVRRRRVVTIALRLLGRRRRPGDLDALAALVGPGAAELPWGAVARGSAG